MFKKILLILLVSIMFVNAGANAAGDRQTPTSKSYVDTEVDTRQPKIPAAGAGNGGIGESVMTYTTDGNGVIGERGIYSDPSSYTAGEDADKLITAAALNTAFTTLPTTPTTTLECANQNCDLWAIVDQTAYGISGDGTTTIDLSALVNVTGTGACAKGLDGRTNATIGVGCDTPLTNIADWGATFPYNDGTVQVNGISACSAVAEGLSTGGIPTNQSGVQADYESNMASAPTRNPVGKNCYCKLTNPAASPWVLINMNASVSVCAMTCATNCGSSVSRGAVLGSVQ